MVRLYCIPLSASALLAYYVWLIGAPPSAVRAWLALAVWMLLQINKNQLSPYTSLLYVALISVLFDPWLPISIGWQLSFWAVLGILLFIEYQYVFIRTNQITKNARPLLHRLKTKLSQLILFQVFITIWMLPLVVWHFQLIASMALVNNLLFTPIVTLIVVPLLVLGVFLGEGSVGKSCLELADVVIEGTWRLGSVITHDWSLVKVSSDLGALLLIALPILYLMTLFLRNRIRAKVFQPACKPYLSLLSQYFVYGVVLIFALFVFDQNKEQSSLVVFDVGQGSANLISTNRTNAIIDLGPVYQNGSSATSHVLYDNLVGLGFRTINHVFITHYDSDHRGDIKALSNLYPYKHATPCGDFSKEGLEVEVLWPPKSVRRSQRQDQHSSHSLFRNEQSCVLKFHMKETGTKVLFSGDISRRVELILARAHHAGFIDLSSDIILSPHHGSRYSSSLPYIYAVNPKLVIHDPGYANRFGFPAQEVIQRYERYGIEQMSTSHFGQIKVDLTPDSNGKFKVSTALTSWSPFWKKQNPFSIHSQIR